MTTKHPKPLAKPINRRTEYQRLLRTLRKRGPQPWVKPSHERNKGANANY